MMSDCELLNHPLLIDGVECPCGAVKTTPPAPEPVTLPDLDRVWWAGIPRLNFGAPLQRCDHPPLNPSPR